MTSPGLEAATGRFEVRFGQVRLSYPTHTEQDDARPETLFPQQARLRNLTYECGLMVDVRRQAFDADSGEREGDEVVEQNFFGRIPVMVRSTYCRLRSLADKDRARYGECVFDQGGYFVINGSEKVVVAQERQAYNRVYCFHKRAPSKLSWVAEVRSRAPPAAPSLAALFAGPALTGALSLPGDLAQRLLPLQLEGVRFLHRRWCLGPGCMLADDSECPPPRAPPRPLTPLSARQWGWGRRC